MAEKILVDPEAFKNAVWDFIQTLKDDSKDTLFILKTGGLSVYFHLDALFDTLESVNEQSDEG